MPLALFIAPLLVTADVALEHQALLGAYNILKAGEAYAISPANKEGRYPGTPADLVKPPFSKFSFLKNKEKDLMDPWGGLYRCRTELDDRGYVRFYAWTERVVDGKVRRIGLPPPEKK